MSAVLSKPPQKRRIAPIALTAAAAPATAPAAAPAAAPAPATTTTATTATNVPLETLDKYIQQSLQGLRDDIDGLLANAFVPDKRTLDELEAGVKRVRGCIDGYNAAAEASERADAAERERLAVELTPVKIQRTEATKALYTEHRAKMGGECRYLYKCPRADALGVCAHGSASRPFHPSARNHVRAHIERFHLGNDPLTETLRTWRKRETDQSFWDGGANETRAKAFAMGERVQVTKAGDSRLGQYGHVTKNVPGGAIVRFSDGTKEGFWCSSIKAEGADRTRAKARRREA